MRHPLFWWLLFVGLLVLGSSFLVGILVSQFLDARPAVSEPRATTVQASESSLSSPSAAFDIDVDIQVSLFRVSDSLDVLIFFRGLSQAELSVEAVGDALVLRHASQRRVILLVPEEGDMSSMNHRVEIYHKELTSTSEGAGKLVIFAELKEVTEAY